MARIEELEKMPDVVDEELLSRMYEAMRRHTREGDPVKAYALQDHITNRTVPPGELLYFGEVRPQKFLGTELPDMPPRVGKGATELAWRDFAKKVSNLEPEIIDRMTRGDIQNALQAQGVIPAPEEEEEELS